MPIPVAETLVRRGVLLLAALLLYPLLATSAAAFGVPAMVKDINPGGASSTPLALRSIGSKLVFFADNGVAGVEPWVSDGTSGGTFLLSDIWAGGAVGFYSGSPENSAVSIGNTAFFSASDGSGGYQLWKTDGTSVGTVKVYSGSTATGLAKVGSEVWFAGTSGTPYRSDGTVGNATQVSNNSYILGDGVTEMGGFAYYCGNDGFSGWELFRSDGTQGGTARLKDINVGSNDAIPVYLTNIGGTLYFAANNGAGLGLWKSDGSSGGTVLVKQIGLQGGASLDTRQIVGMNGVVYFIGNHPSSGQELWRSDGTTLGTAIVKDIYPGAGGSMPGSYLIVIGNTLYFKAANATHGYELWKSDGTETGTVMVKDIKLGGSSIPTSLTNINGTLFFKAEGDGLAGGQPWTSDGTELGTQQLASIYPSNNSAATSFTDVNGTVFFSASNGTNGVELWAVAGSLLDVDPVTPSAGSGIALAQSDPNPVSSTTRIAFTLPNEQHVSLRLFDAQGRVVQTLLDRREGAGSHRVELDARGLSGGVYFYRLEAGTVVRQRKLVVLPR